MSVLPIAAPTHSLEVNKDFAPVSEHSLLTVKETAVYLRIPVPTVYYLVQRGQLPAVRIGGRWRIKKELLDLDVLKTQRAIPVAPSATPTPILIVDDEEPICQVLLLAMSHKGYSADTAHTGAEAIRKLQDKAYEVVFLDIRLPDMDGEALFSHVCELSHTPHLVLMTGFPVAPMLENMLMKNPVTILQKPLKLDQVIRITDLLLTKIG